MSEYYFTFHSLTHGQSAAQIMREHGIPVSLNRAPKALAQQGCGYALQLYSMNPLAQYNLLRANGASPGHVYRRMPNGLWEELPF